MWRAYIILGSNIEPEENIRTAFLLLGEKLRLLRRSSVWETAPVGTGGANFLNLVVEIETDLGVEDLKFNLLRKIEERMGRVRTADKYAPRPIDLDIIWYDSRVVDDAVWRQAYIAAPLAELMPNLPTPDGRLLYQLAADLRKSSFAELRLGISF